MLKPSTTDTKPNKCCTETNLEFYDGGDGVEWETWECQKCYELYVLPIEIQRYFNDIKSIKHNNRSK